MSHSKPIQAFRAHDFTPKKKQYKKNGAKLNRKLLKRCLDAYFVCGTAPRAARKLKYRVSVATIQRYVRLYEKTVRDYQADRA